MKILTILISFLVFMTTSGCFNRKSSFSDWADPSYVTDLMARDLASYISEEGLLYPSNDLDDPLLHQRKIVINNAMNEQTSKEVVRKLLYLNALNPKVPIDLYISTQGGWYDSAFTIIDTFYAIDAPVNTICIGGCYSAGIVLLAAGTGDRISLPNALFSLHISYNRGTDERPYAHRPDRINDFLKKVTKLPTDWFPLDDNRYYYLTPKEVLGYGIIDKVK